MAFFLNTAIFCINLYLNRYFLEKCQFFRRKLVKIAENCYHNIDPLALVGIWAHNYPVLEAGAITTRYVTMPGLELHSYEKYNVWFLNPKIRRNVPRVRRNVPNVRRNVPKVRQNVPKIRRNVPKLGEMYQNQAKCTKIRRNVPNVRRNIPKVGRNVPG
jgi:hypothetical protein